MYVVYTVAWQPMRARACFTEHVIRFFLATRVRTCVKRFEMSTAAQLLVGGERQSGASIRSQNGEGKREFAVGGGIILLLRCECVHLCAVTAAVSVANIVKTSLGPVGLDKMLVDDVGVRL